MKTLAFVPVLALIATSAAALHENAADASAGRCETCHVAATPAEGSADLKQCARLAVGPAAAHGSAEAPDFFILDQLTDIYVPVVFPHKLHASMTEMGSGCTICHHRNPEGPILGCAECHGGPSNPVNLRQPGLKGAYHRQCLGCHREWTHETDCVICHAKRVPGKDLVLPADDTDIMGLLHPNIEVPDLKVYEIKNELLSESPFVSFHHKQHVELFGYKCVDCHQQESCNRCHDTGVRQPHIKQDAHEDCTKCHQEQIDNDCAHCHDAAVRQAGFSHATATGFDTGLYHSLVVCTECHTKKEEQGFSGLEPQCSGCHAPDFQPDPFDHALTGQPLGEVHAAIGCADCHPEGVGGPANCSTCHDYETNPTDAEIP